MDWCKDHDLFGLREQGTVAVCIFDGVLGKGIAPGEEDQVRGMVRRRRLGGFWASVENLVVDCSESREVRYLDFGRLDKAVLENAPSFHGGGGMLESA